MLRSNSLPKELLIKATDTNSFSLIIRKVGESLNKIVKILVSKSSKTFNVADFLEKFENSSRLSQCKNCWFASILCFRNGQVYFYITDLVLSCLPHARLFTDKVNFSVLSSALNFLGNLDFSLTENLNTDSICHLLKQVSNPHRCILSIKGCSLTSKGAVEFASLLPRFQKVTRLDLHLAECSAEAVSTLVAAIKHESLVELELSEIILTPAVVESLSQSLPELTALEILRMKGSSGRNLHLHIPVYSSSFGTLSITGLTENAATAITRLSDVFKNKPLGVVELSVIKLTSKLADALGQFLPELSVLRRLSISSLNECSDEAATKLVAAIKHKTLEKLELRKINLTSAAAEGLAQLLPELSALRTLDLGSLTKCSDKAVRKLVTYIKHKNLDQLCLHGINLTSAVAEALVQLLREPSSLQTLELSFSDGCTLRLQFPVFVWKVPTLETSSLTKGSGAVVLSLIEVIKNRTIENLKLSNVALTSAVAEALAQLLPELSALRALSLGSLTECSDEAVTKLVASIKHKNLDQLYLHRINLTSAAAEAFRQLLPELSALRILSLGFLTECSDEAVTKVVASIKHKHLDQLYLHGIDLTSAAAEALGQLLPVLSSLRTLSLGSLTECSDEAVTKLVASIKHKNLDELYLHGISLTSAVAEALGQLLREPSSLQTLQLSFSDGCTLWLRCAVFIWEIPKLEIRGLTENSAEVVLSLIEVIKNRIIWELKLSNIALTSAVTEALTQSLLELSSLRTLRISGSVECSLQHKELEALFGRFNRPSSLTELSITRFSARGSLGSFANKLCFFPNLEALVLEDLDMGEADLSDLLKNLKFTPDLRSLSLMGNPLGHAVRSMIPYLIEQQKLKVVFFRRGDCSEEDFQNVQEAVKEKRLRLEIKTSWWQR